LDVPNGLRGRLILDHSFTARHPANLIGANDEPEEVDFCDSEMALLGLAVKAKFSCSFEHFSYLFFVLLVGRVYQYVVEVADSKIVNEVR
jgi:hypothetical protein